jgi:hypothetical protein
VIQEAQADETLGQRFDENVVPYAGYKRKGAAPEPVRAPFPSKENRKFQIPLLYPPNTWMLDIMFSQLPTAGQSLAYLVMINTLTRKLYTELLNPTVDGRVQFGEARNAENIKNALERMLNGSGLRNFHLIGDAEPGFSSAVVGAWLRQHGADFKAVARQQSVFPDWMGQANSKAQSAPDHRKLAIADRVIRTIRDIAFSTGRRFRQRK